MQAIFGIVLIIAVFVSYRVSSNKGYSGIPIALGTLFFPILLFVVFALPDKSQAAKRAEIEHAFDESTKQLESTHPKAEAPKKVQPKAEAKPAQPKAEQTPAQPKVADREVTADTPGEFEYAEKYFKNGQYILALPLYENVAATGHRYSQMRCAQMYYQGQGCEVDQKKALYWYEKAAAQGHPVGQQNCGFMYKAGQGCTVDLKKALYWKEKAAEQGDKDMQFDVGMMYELGEGCTVDPRKARFWYEKAAAQGHANAQRLLDGMR